MTTVDDLMIVRDFLRFVMDSRLQSTIRIIFVNTLLVKKGVLKYMAEAIISRRGNGTGGGSSGTLVTQSIVTNQEWKVPNNIVNNLAIVRVFGGGGGGYYKPQTTTGGFFPQTVPEEKGGGGGGGWMNNKYIDLSGYVSVPITIGAGGVPNNGSPTAGGTTSFGVFLSANGGEAGSSCGGGGGGAGGGGVQKNSSIAYGGNGYQFGAGGGSKAASGGPWGGGTGQIQFSWVNSATLYWSQSSGGSGSGGVIANSYKLIGSDSYVYAQAGIGGNYGGNGGNLGNIGFDGTNTLGNKDIEERLRGDGKGGNCYGGTCGGPGGGYGGRGGNSSFGSNMLSTSSGGGGTGYHEYWSYSNSRSYGISGGGGGYGGNGGNSDYMVAGGGGGYGGKGGDGLNGCGGGGGSYGDGAQFNRTAGYGGGGTYQYAGGSGICIIQYYTK